MAQDGMVDYLALADFRYALRKFLAFSEDAAAEAGLTSQQHQALLVIKARGGEKGIAVGLLAERLLVRQHSAVELVDRLSRLGLVSRNPDPHDRRRVLVALTEEGEERLSTLSQAHFAELRAVGPALAELLASFEK
jgi:DNA-binding MarR family transcriptional regulator